MELFALTIIIKENSDFILEEALDKALTWANERTAASLNNKPYYVDVYDSRVKRYFKVYSDLAKTTLNLTDNVVELTYNSVVGSGLTAEQNSKLMSLKNNHHQFDMEWIEEFSKEFKDIKKEIKIVKDTTDNIGKNILKSDDKRLNNLKNLDKKISEVKELELSKIEDLFNEYEVDINNFETIVKNNIVEIDLSNIENVLKQISEKEDVDLTPLQEKLNLIISDNDNQYQELKKELELKTNKEDIKEVDLTPITSKLEELNNSFDNNLNNITKTNNDNFDKILLFLKDNNITIEEIWNYSNRRLTSEIVDQQITEEDFIKTMKRK